MVKKKTPKKPLEKASRQSAQTEVKKPKIRTALPKAAIDSEKIPIICEQPEKDIKSKQRSGKQSLSTAKISKNFLESEEDENIKSPIKRNNQTPNRKLDKEKADFSEQDEQENSNDNMLTKNFNKVKNNSASNNPEKNKKTTKRNKKRKAIKSKKSNFNSDEYKHLDSSFDTNKEEEKEEEKDEENKANKNLKYNFTKNKNSINNKNVNLLENEAELVDPDIADSLDYIVLPDLAREFDGRFFSVKFSLKNTENKKRKKSQIELLYKIQILNNPNSKEFFLLEKSAQQGSQAELSLKKCKTEKQAIKLFLQEYRNKLTDGYQLENTLIDAKDEIVNKKLSKEKNSIKDISSNSNEKMGSDNLIKLNNKANNQQNLVESQASGALPAKSKTANTKKTKKKFFCLFDETVKSLLLLLSDQTLMHRQMKLMGFDALKLPFERLTPLRLREALGVLRDIELVLKKNKQVDLFELSSFFYKIIPHVFGYQKMSSFAIDSFKKLKEKTDMVQALADIETAVKMIAKSNEMQDKMSKLNCLYMELNCEIKTIPTNSEAFNLLALYLKNNTSNNKFITMQIESVFRLAKPGRAEKAMPFSRDKKLLWHGMRSSSLISALSQGLMNAPEQAPDSCFLFGKGIYFTDMAEKVLGYCYPFDNTSFLLLSEVALGNVKEMNHYNCKAAEILGEFDSILGKGTVFPNPEESKEIDGVEIPLGKPIFTKEKTALQYNEYIVYDADRVNMKYLLKLKIISNKNN